MSAQKFDFGEVVENERQLLAILSDDARDMWIDYPAMDNAMYFQLRKFTMHNRRYKAIYDVNDNHAFIQVESGFVPCGWFKIRGKRVQ